MPCHHQNTITKHYLYILGRYTFVLHSMKIDDTLYICNVCNMTLPMDIYKNEPNNFNIHVCKSCREKSKKLYRNYLLETYCDHIKFEETTSLHIYTRNNTIRYYTNPDYIQTMDVPSHKHYVSRATLALLDVYTNIIIEQLSNPTPIINCIKLDNKDIIHHLQSNPPYILTILHNQHNYIYQPIKTNEMLFY